MPEPLITDETLQQVYDQTSATYSTPKPGASAWMAATDKRKHVAILTRDLLHSCASFASLDWVLAEDLAAATVDAAVRLGLVTTPWGEYSELGQEMHVAFAAELLVRARAVAFAAAVDPTATPLDQIQDT